MDWERKVALMSAWHTAALSRAKRMPRLHRFLNPPESKPLTGVELEKRRQERDEMLEGLDLDAINKQMREIHGR